MNAGIVTLIVGMVLLTAGQAKGQANDINGLSDKLVCRDSLVSFVVDGKERVESTRVCVNQWTRPSGAPLIQAFASENCVKQSAVGTSCLAIRKAVEAQSSRKSDDVAFKLIAPMRFDLCLRLGGEPESIKFRWNLVWHVTDRCRFNEDFSYIDATSFYDLEKSPLKQLR